jgi:hypothetical protein
MKLLLTVCILFFVSHLSQVAQALSFIEAISAYPQLSNFTNLLKTNPGLAAPFNSFSPSAPQTVLVPDNDAFLSFQNSTGYPFGSEPYAYIQAVISYQLLNGNLSTQYFLQPSGVTVPTALTGPMYNNRTAGSGLVSSVSTGNPDGQVVFIAPDTTPTVFNPRQLSSPLAYVQSGVDDQVNLTTIDGVWDGGMFQIVDGYMGPNKTILRAKTNIPLDFSPFPRLAPKQSEIVVLQLSMPLSTVPAFHHRSTTLTMSLA